jgi:hypothetical protein
MNRPEVIKSLTDNVDKIVRVIFNDGQDQTIKVHLVDDEGIVYYLASSNEVDNQAYWAFFKDVENVLQLDKSK